MFLPCILQGIDFHLPRGSKTAIVGRSGCGKSTLVKLLTRLYAPSRGTPPGTPSIFGVPLDELDAASVCATVEQQVVLMDGTVRENIAFGLVATNEEIAEAAKGAMLWDDVQAMSDGFETWVGFNGARSMVEWPS